MTCAWPARAYILKMPYFVHSPLAGCGIGSLRRKLAVWWTLFYETPSTRCLSRGSVLLIMILFFSCSAVSANVFPGSHRPDDPVLSGSGWCVIFVARNNPFNVEDAS